MFQNDEEVLEFLGINLESFNADILSAIIQTQGMTGSTFEDILGHLQHHRGKEANQSLVYRGLAELEKDGLISIDKSEHIHIYNSGFDHLERVIGNLLPRSINVLRAELKDIEQSRKELTQINLIELARYMVEILTGEKARSKSRFALGVQNIYHLIKSEIYDDARFDDVIRMSLGWGGPEMHNTLLSKENLEKLIEVGSIIQILVPSDWEPSSDLISIISGLEHDDMKIRIRKRTHTHATYQFVSLNEQSLIMVTAEKPLSAAYIPQYVNHVLIADAIRIFDKEFSSASSSVEVLL